MQHSHSSLERTCIKVEVAQQLKMTSQWIYSSNTSIKALHQKEDQQS